MGKWSKAQHQHFRATMKRKNGGTEIPLDAIDAGPAPEVPCAIAYSRGRKKLFLMIDETAFNFKVIP